MTMLEMIWFPVLCVVLALTWMVLSISGALARRRAARHTGTVSVRLPEGATIVRDDGTDADS